MSQPIDPSFSSKKSLLRTIKNDNIVYYWFSLLLLNKSIKDSLSHNKAVSCFYKEFIASLYSRFILVSFFTIFLSAMFFYDYSKLHWIVLFLTIVLYIAAHKRGFKAFCNIFEEFIGQNFNSDCLKQKTLYQIGEFYGNKYQIPTLVETLHFNIKTYTSFFAVSFIFWVFIYPINTFVTCLGILTSMLIIRIYFNTFSLLKHLKNYK